MKKEFVASAQFAGIPALIAYSQIPIISNFYFLAFLFIWKLCGPKYAGLFLGLDFVLTLPLEVQETQNIIGMTSSFLSLSSKIRNWIDSIASINAVNHHLATNPYLQTIEGQFTELGLLLEMFAVIYFFYVKPIKKFIKFADDIKIRVRWRNTS